MLSHELRNPLAPVRNAVHVIRQCGIDHPQVVWARDVIDRQVTHLVRLVDDLLDVSRITRGKIHLQTRVVDLADDVASAIETIRPTIQRHRHELSVSLPEQPIQLIGDPARLAQVFSNLLNNAAKYTPEGGHIWLAVAKELNEAVIRVRDTGSGIPTDMLTRIFDMFTQMDHSIDRAQGGLGVGLTLVRRLVELHGGRVEALSAGLGQGSEFTVHLPIGEIEKNPSAGIVERTPKQKFTRRRQVLVVDDNKHAADTLAMLLERAGHDVRLAHDGPKALEATATFRPDVLLLHIGFPGFDGYEVARRLRAEPESRSILLVAVSGFGQEEDRERCRQVGIDKHLTKPVDYDTLETLMSSVVG